MKNTLKISVKDIALLSVIAGLYVALSLLIAPLSYGIVQFRLSEVLVLLCFFNKKFNISLVIGCFITNLFSPFGLDILFGTLHTLISVIFISKSKHLFVAALWPTVFSFIIGLELFIYGEPFWLSTLSVLVSEFVVINIIGYLIFKCIENNQQFKNFVK